MCSIAFFATLYFLFPLNEIAHAYVTSEPWFLTNLIQKFTGDRVAKTRALFYRYGLQPNDPVEVGFTNWSCTHPDVTSQIEDYIGALLKTWCNGSDEERVEVNLQLREIAKKRRQLEMMMGDMTYLLVDNDDEKREIMMNEHFPVKTTKQSLECVKNITDLFKRTCLKPGSYNPYLDRMSFIFIRACQEDWLNENKVYAVTKLVCAEQVNLEDVY